MMQLLSPMGRKLCGLDLKPSGEVFGFGFRGARTFASQRLNFATTFGLGVGGYTLTGTSLSKSSLRMTGSLGEMLTPSSENWIG